MAARALIDGARSSRAVPRSSVSRVDHRRVGTLIRQTNGRGVRSAVGRGAWRLFPVEVCAVLIEEFERDYRVGVVVELLTGGS